MYNQSLAHTSSVNQNELINVDDVSASSSAVPNGKRMYIDYIQINMKSYHTCQTMIDDALIFSVVS